MDEIAILPPSAIPTLLSPHRLVACELARSVLEGHLTRLGSLAAGATKPRPANALILR
ncbi:MAG: hypothetical protein ACRDGI_01450 [Candidatus Limnocylindrales bacterium]